MTNALFLDLAFLAALVAGLYAAWRGSVAAWALILGTALTSFLAWRGVPFNAAVWTLVDIGVISGAVAASVKLRRNLTVRDALVGLLFLPSWFGYSSDEAWAIEAAEVAVTMQFLLTVPWKRVGDDVRRLARAVRARLPHGDNLAVVSNA